VIERKEKRCRIQTDGEDTCREECAHISEAEASLVELKLGACGDPHELD